MVLIMMTYLWKPKKLKLFSKKYKCKKHGSWALFFPDSEKHFVYFIICVLKNKQHCCFDDFVKKHKIQEKL